MKKVIYIAKDYIYINEDDRVVKRDFSFERGLVTTTIGYNNILNISFRLPKSVDKKNIDREFLELEAEKYLFKEGSLSYDKDYKIIYKFEEAEYSYNVDTFIVEIDVLKKEFSDYVRSFKYIDFISARPFVFKSFYDINNVVPKKDGFIYFSEGDSFLSCFENGKFVFVKGLNKLSSLANELGLSNKEVIELLREKGLDEDSYENKGDFKVVEEFFSELFMRVNNLLNYNLDKFDRIYFYSPFEINGLFEKYKSFWSLSSVEFNKYEVDSEYDAFDYTALIYNSNNYQNEKENFSVFVRPLPFYKTKIGRLIIFVIAGLLLVGADAYLKHQKTLKQQREIDMLNKEILKNKEETDALLKRLKALKDELGDLKTENAVLEKQLLDAKDRVEFLKNIQFSKLTTNEIADIVNGLSKYNLKLISLNKSKNGIELEIISRFKDSSKIASFMKYLSSLGYKNIKSNEIKHENELYIAKVNYNG